MTGTVEAYSADMKLAEALLALGQSEDRHEMSEAVLAVHGIISDLQRQVHGLTKAVYLLTESADPDIRDKTHAAYAAEIGEF